MVTAKSGESYDGCLESIDSFMNVKLTKVVITSAGPKAKKHNSLKEEVADDEPLFSSCQECFVRGNNIKTIQFEQEKIDKHFAE